MQTSSLHRQLDELLNILEQQKAELAALQRQVAALEAAGPPAATPGQAPAPTSRRRALKIMAAGLSAGVVAAAGAQAPDEAEATALAGFDDRIGLVTTPPGAAPTGSLNPAATTNYGLVGLSGSLNLNMLPNVSAGIVGLSDSGCGVYSLGSAGMVATSTFGVGAVGECVSGEGVYAESLNATAIFTSATQDRAAVAESANGAPFRIKPGTEPTSGVRNDGEMYVDLDGNLHIFTITTQSWRRVKFV